MIPQPHPAYKKWLDRVFEPIADAVGDFAQRHRMQLEKCPFKKKDWMLAAGHPAGGNVFLILRYSVIRGLTITGVWQVGEPERSVYHVHARKGRRCRIEPTEVTAILEDELRALAGTVFGDWTSTHPIPDAANRRPST